MLIVVGCDVRLQRFPEELAPGHAEAMCQGLCGMEHGIWKGNRCLHTGSITVVIPRCKKCVQFGGVNQPSQVGGILKLGE